MDEYDVDINRWMTQFPLDESDHSVWEGSCLQYPRQLAELEQLRRRITAKTDLGKAVATDVFLYGIGEPLRRDVTKVGGLPYRPAQKPWPIGPDGKPMTFLVQYRFVESHDIVGTMPGDVLLVFVHGDDLCSDDPLDFTVYEWYSLGMDDLVQTTPEPVWSFVTCYGVRHRTVEYPEHEALEKLAAFVPADRPDLFTPSETPTSLLRVFPSTKIGGVPFWTYPEYIDPERDLPGRFLCALSSIYAPPDCPHPWVNQEQPISLRECGEPRQHLDIRDGFILNFSIDQAGVMHRNIQFW